jgi:hypothetical protein
MSISSPIREIPWAEIAASEEILEPFEVTKPAVGAGAAAAPFRWINWLLRQTARWIKYLGARGIPDYRSSEDYSAGDCVQHTDGLVYRCTRPNGPGTVRNPGSDASYWSIWPADTTTPGPSYGITVSAGRVAEVYQATFPTMGRMNGWRSISFKIVDVANLGGYVDVTLHGAASLQRSSVQQVTYAGDFDPSQTQPPVIQQPTSDPGLLRIYFTNRAVNGPYPALNVTITSGLP